MSEIYVDGGTGSLDKIGMQLRNGALNNWLTRPTISFRQLHFLSVVTTSWFIQHIFTSTPTNTNKY